VNKLKSVDPDLEYNPRNREFKAHLGDNSLTVYQWGTKELVSSNTLAPHGGKLINTITLPQSYFVMKQKNPAIGKRKLFN
jgi:hypothetical protein